MSTRVLLISHDVVGPSMAGPGIRYYHLARVLGAHFPVTLALPAESIGTVALPGVQLARYGPHDWPSLATHIDAAEVCIIPGHLAGDFSELERVTSYIVIDGYNPLLAEWLAIHRQQDPTQLAADWRQRMAQLARQVQIGDFFLCASERQRDWWLGLLEANGRLNPATYAADPTLRNLVDVVAYGLPPDLPVHTRNVLKGLWAGIQPADRLVLWGGGLWPWLDPVTAVRAVARIVSQRPDVKLIFPGAKHPNPRLAKMPTLNASARTVAAELGLLDRAVYFGDWVPYADWPSLLLECDVALTLHFETLETRLAYRSRVLEYIWAGLPTVAARGDATAELIEGRDLGIVVDCEDVDGVAAAILRLLDEPLGARAEQFAAARQELTWERVAAPLIEYCRSPRHAADREAGLDEPCNYYNPSATEQVRQEREHWEAIIQAYEAGRMMRLLKWANRQTQAMRKWIPSRPGQ